jgi:UDP-glucose 4-epimerase
VHVVVTGGAGFIGGHTSRALLERGHRVTAIDDLSRGRREALPEGAALEVLDVRSPDALAAVERLRPDAIVHLAAQIDVRKSVIDPIADAGINVLGTVNLLEAARRAGVRRFVLASTGGAVYGEQDRFPAREDHARRPASPYGVSKLCAEEYVRYAARAHGLSTLALRYANVYGPGQDPHGEAGVVAIFAGKMLDGVDPVINGDGMQTRDYVHVEDVARANAAAVESAFDGALNVGTGVESTVVDVHRAIAAELGFTPPAKFGPGKAGEQRRSCVDPSAAAGAIGWRPRIALTEGLAQTARWFRDQRTRGAR